MADKFQLKAIISAVDKITPTLKGIQRASRLTQKTLRDIASAGRNMMGSVGLPAGLAFGAIAYGAISATRAALGYAGAIQDATDRTGSSLDSYQILSALLEKSGGSAEDAETAFTNFNKGISEAASGGNAGFAELLGKLHIGLKNAKGEVRSLTDVLPELADAFAANENSAMRTRMAKELFGKSGTKLLPILTSGKKAFAAMSDEQRRFGTIMRDDAITALDDAGDAAGLLGKQVKVQLIQGLASVVPVILPIIRSMSEWIAANKELIQANLTKALTDIVAALKQVDWESFIGSVRGAAIEIKDFVQIMGGMKNLLLIMGVLWIAGPVAAILSVVMAVGRATMALSMMMFSVRSTATGYSVMGAIPVINTALGVSFAWLRTQALAAMFAFRIGGVAGVFSAAMGSIAGILPAVGAALMTAGRAALFLGRAILLTPLGIVMALAGAALLIYENWDTLKKWFFDFTDWIGKKFTWIADQAKSLIPDWMKNMFSGSQSISVMSGPASPGGFPFGNTRPQTPLVQSGALAIMGNQNQNLNGEINVRFENAPAGMRVDQGSTNQPGVSMNPDVGYRSLSYGF